MKLGIGLGIAIIALATVFSIRTCNRPVTNPAIEMLQHINDSLYQVIHENIEKTDSLYIKIDSLSLRGDTIIQLQDVTNKYYTNEVYTILNSNDVESNKQFRSTLKKSDSLLKSGFYTKTYDLRRAANEP